MWPAGKHLWIPGDGGKATRCCRCERVKNPVNAAMVCERAESAAPAPFTPPPGRRSKADRKAAKALVARGVLHAGAEEELPPPDLFNDPPPAKKAKRVARASR